MERYLQDKRDSRSDAVGMNDPWLGTSTLLKPQSQNKMGMRQSYEEHASGDARKRKQDIGADEEELSDNELLIPTSKSRKNVKIAKSTVSRPKIQRYTKKRSSNKDNGPKASTVKKTEQMNPTKRNGSFDSNEEDSRSTDGLNSKAMVGPKAMTKKSGTLMSRKEVKFKSNGVEEIDSSGDELSGPKPKKYSSGDLPSGPRPFPMDLSSTLSSSQTSSRSVTPIPTVSSGSPPRKVKTEETYHSGPAQSYTQIINEDKTDHSLLCPFCDQVLPEFPSAVLNKMLKRLRRTAKPEPRIGNSLGLSATLEAFAPFCLRHEAESKEFPKGKKKGWPTTLDPKKLAKRTRKLKSSIQYLIDNPEEGHFLLPLRKSAMNHGNGAVNGAKANWLNFENATAGYYGEQGFAIISQVLFDIFPAIPTEKTDPLDPSNYFSLVLVPETALLLIQQDLQTKASSTREEDLRYKALHVLRDSRKYGEAMFPVLEEEEDTAGDEIARERARKMRKLREDKESSQVSIGPPLNLTSEDDVDSTPVKRREEPHLRADRSNIRSVSEATPRPIKRRINLKGQEVAFKGFPNSAGSESYRWLLSD